MLQVLQKSLPVTSKIRLMRSMMLPMRYNSTISNKESANQPKGIKEYNDSLQNLETLSEIVEENLDKFTRANCSTRFLNSSIISEVESTIEKLKDGETKRVKIRDNIHSALQDKLNNISYT
ncbi:hypothetical protein RhiirA5_356582 [Rhizophagus irregularis]|uniref:Uncharacterized protein n=1 Tax=Rhizophagus irregularis TaxID=588596 RepID=A0A2N0PRR1_9GLOM|nr:hypothetical protein RhiirA5_356582 [Rhizophagus irregularis]PKC65450.1 hypothetical protein RhiirA1_420422 [Rhizophagus irregularis]